MTENIAAPPLPSEAGKLRELRRMKAGATLLLVAFAVMYAIATRWDRHGAPGWVGYWATATEAGMVGALARHLRELGLGRGDAVAGYLPNVPEAVVAMLATTSVGARWAVCSPDFGTSSVAERFTQVEPKVLIAADGYRFNGIDHDRVDAVGDLLAGLPSVVETIVVAAAAVVVVAPVVVVPAAALLPAPRRRPARRPPPAKAKHRNSPSVSERIVPWQFPHRW